MFYWCWPTAASTLPVSVANRKHLGVQCFFFSVFEETCIYLLFNYWYLVTCSNFYLFRDSIYLFTIANQFTMGFIGTCVLFNWMSLFWPKTMLNAPPHHHHHLLVNHLFGVCPFALLAGRGVWAGRVAIAVACKVTGERGADSLQEGVVLNR